MKIPKYFLSTLLGLGISSTFLAQEITSSKPNTQQIIHEAVQNSQLEQLAHELMDVIGGRLVGSPQIKQANDWLVLKYKDWNISAENQAYGEWKAWERGNTTLELTTPRKQQLIGRQLAWSPNMKKPIEAETILLPTFQTEADLNAFLPLVKGKIVLCAPYFQSGRPEHQWKEFATEEDYLRYKNTKDSIQSSWDKSIHAAGSLTKLIEKLELGGAAGIITNSWTGIISANRVFDAKTKKIPQVDMQNEDYLLVYRLTKAGNAPKLKLQTESKHMGTAQIFNTIASIPGTSLKEEYVMISAHLDSWDGATGATDNGTGTILMMEVARIIQKLYPNPKRTILIGHWNSEEQGLNGSTAFVNDHPEIIQNLKVLFNQDSGTGRINSINGQGFTQAYDYLGRWLQQVPDSLTKHIALTFPGVPQTRGTDNVPFVAAGVPAFSFGSQNWGYGPYTWHTNLDTYDKIVFDEVMKNVITTAILTIEAADDEHPISNEKRIMPLNANGEAQEWPALRQANRKGRMD